MPPPAARDERRWGDAAALILLGAGAAAAWSGDLGSGVLWLAPTILAAALVTVGSLGRRSAIVLAIVWPPVAILAAGLPTAALAPAAFAETVASLGDGVRALAATGAVAPIVAARALAAALLVGGVAVILGAILWRSSGRALWLFGFVLLVAPLAAAIAMREVPDSPWPGALILAALILRVARGRLPRIAAAATALGAIAFAGALVAAPSQGWQPFGGHRAHEAGFHELSTLQTYGPLEGRRTGAVMLDVTATRPALWRMRVLESFDNRRWRVANEDIYLPEPAARPQSIEVKVRGLTNSLLVSPGKMVHMHTERTVGALGDARLLAHRPSEGETYWVTANVVHPTVARLATIPVPRGNRYLSVTGIGLAPLPVQIPNPLNKLADHVPAPLKGTDWARLFRLSSRLSAGVTTELGQVRRVENYLLGSGRFRYTTDVGAPGPEPLLEFLFHTHAGYCQHFAGAAALLLRVAGVPTRVAVGFATGEQIGKHTWAVRDEDAHAWIEVYFPGVGWVPFNPTPPSSAADVAPGLDVLQPAAAPASGLDGTPADLVAAVAAAAILVLLASTGALRRRGAPDVRLASLLAGLSPRPPGPRTTLRDLGHTLTSLGPATADLALVAERARFSHDGPLECRGPRLTVWRALTADVGIVRASGLTLRAARNANRR